jgi:hypothetical protein
MIASLQCVRLRALNSATKMPKSAKSHRGTPMALTVPYLDPESLPRIDPETHFLRELGRLDDVITDFLARRTAMLRALAQERQRRIAKNAGSSKRARQCASVQIQVLSALRLAETATLSARELLNRVKIGEPHLKTSTFHSVLHRMRAKNLIMPSPGQRGVWTLSPVRGP